MENEDLIDYEEEVSVPTSGAAQTDAGASAGAPAASGADEGNKKGSYVGIPVSYTHLTLPTIYSV